METEIQTFPHNHNMTEREIDHQIPPIPSRSESRERGKDRWRTRPLSYSSSPQLRPSPFSQDQIFSRPSSKHSSLRPPASTYSTSPSPDRERSTSPYPSPFTTTPSNNLLSPEEGQSQGLHRQSSTRLEIATAIRQPSFPQFRNSIITKPSMSLITRPGIIHVQPSQPLSLNSNSSPTTPCSASTAPSPLTACTTPVSGSTDYPVLGINKEARVSLINVVRPSTGSEPSTRTRESARASLLAGPGPAIRPNGPRPMLIHAHTDPIPSSDRGFSDAEAEEKARFEDMKVEQIVGPREERGGIGLRDVKRMIGDVKEGQERRKGKKSGKKELWTSMYSMSGETLGEGEGNGSGYGSRLGIRMAETPDRLMSPSDGGFSPGMRPEEMRRGKRGMGSMGWWKKCLGR